MNIEKKDFQEKDRLRVDARRQRIEVVFDAVEDLERQQLTFYKCQSAHAWEHDRHYLDDFIALLLKRELEFSEEKEEDLRVTIEELVGNAVAACDKQDDDSLTITLKAFLQEGQLVVQISDEGMGFDHENEVAARQADDRGLTRDKVVHMLNYPDMADAGGTGTYCLLHLTQGFRYNASGNQVTMLFDLAANPDEKDG